MKKRKEKEIKSEASEKGNALAANRTRATDGNRAARMVCLHDLNIY